MRVRPLVLSIVVLMAACLSAQTPDRTRPAPPVYPAPPWKCPGNLVTNGGFTSNTVIVGNGSMPGSTTAAWTRAYLTPQLQGPAGGFHDPYYVSLWGNQAVGEAIQQPVSFLANHTYSISLGARYRPDPGKVIPNVNIVLRGSTSPLTNTACLTGCETIMTTTPPITLQQWSTYTALWTPTQPLSWLTISPSNGSNVNHGSKVSFGQIDNVCIREIRPPVIEGPSNSCTAPATYCVTPPATAPFTWTVNGGTFQPANANGSCILVTWNTLNNGGSIQATSTVQGHQFTSNLNVKECKLPSCCIDVLNASLKTTEIVSGGMSLGFALSGPTAATTVKATVVGASHVWQPSSCGTSGPITATMSSTQPQPPSGWSPPVVPFLNGNQVVWQSNGSPLGPNLFQVNVQLPPSGSSSCNDKITICIEFEATFPATANQPCRTCTIVRCFTFTRCPLCA